MLDNFYVFLIKIALKIVLLCLLLTWEGKAIYYISKNMNSKRNQEKKNQFDLISQNERRMNEWQREREREKKRKLSENFILVF